MITIEAHNGRQIRLNAAKEDDVAKIFQMHSFRRRSETHASLNDEPYSPDFSPLRRGTFLPIDLPKRVSGDSWQKSNLRAPLSTLANFLPVIAIVSGLYLTGIGRKSGDTNPKQDERVTTRATPPPSQPGQTISKPSPIIAVGTVRADNSIKPEQTPDAFAHSPASSVPYYPAIRYEATRKKVFGSCTGRLELTNSRLRFRCPNKTDLIFPVATIAKANKDGVVLKSGEKYHFMIANHTKGQVEAIFVSWLNRVQ
jgi:hypothetical protein